MKSAVLSLGCIALAPAVALAFQPVVTDDTGTQGAGGNQIEVAYNRTRDTAPDARVVTHEWPLTFTRGITDALDVYAGIAYQRIVPTAPDPVGRELGAVFSPNKDLDLALGVIRNVRDGAVSTTQTTAGITRRFR